MANIKKWTVTVAKSGVLEIEAESEWEAIEKIENSTPTNNIQWEDSWNIVDIENAVNE